MACKDWDVDPSPNSTNAWRFWFRTVRTDPTAVTGRLPFAGGRARIVAMLGSDALIVERCRTSESFCTGGSRGLRKCGERRAKRHIMTAGQSPQHKAWPVLVFMTVRNGCDVWDWSLKTSNFQCRCEYILLEWIRVGDFKRGQARGS